MVETLTTPREEVPRREDGHLELATLTVIDHDRVELIGVRHHFTSEGEVLLGRDADSILPGVFDDGLTSRRHARITSMGRDHDAPGHVIADLQSRNGTRVNGARITTQPLVYGDVIDLGGVVLLYHRAMRLAPRAVGGTALNASPIVSVSAAMQLVEDQIARVARHPVTVLIEGETGVGKELVAQRLHQLGGAGGALVAVNCSGVADTLLQSELFGHVRGAFTGAERSRAGLIEAARGGTLFLDELTDASPALQASLLRLVETRRYRPLGSDQETEADTRFVVAVQPRVHARLDDGGFRLDLWTRLCQWPIRIPPLRQRCDDIGLLVRYFLRLATREELRLTPEVLVRVVRHGWSGNVRALRAFVERAALCAEREPSRRAGAVPSLVVPAWLVAELDGASPSAAVQPAVGSPSTAAQPAVGSPSTAAQSAAGSPSTAAQPAVGSPSTAVQSAVAARTARPERARLEALLSEHQGNIRRIATLLGVERRTLYRWLDQLGLDPGRHRSGAAPEDEP